MWKRKYRVAVLTASDQGAKNERIDQSGPLICNRMTDLGCEIAGYLVLSDDMAGLSNQLRQWSASGDVDLILTTGGTGLSLRDQMPEACLQIAHRLAPGFSEAIRMHSMSITPRGMLSRGVSVICHQTLIINLPGSPKAVNESLDAILPALEHGLDILCNHDGDCSR